jgi:hypothetical protein
MYFYQVIIAVDSNGWFTAGEVAGGIDLCRSDANGFHVGIELR